MQRDEKMYHFNARFSLITSVLCLCVIFGAGAAPSVRVLGSNTGYSSSKSSGTTKATAVKTGNSVKSSLSGVSSGAKKAASVKTTGTKATSVIPGTRAVAKKSAANTHVNGVSIEETRFPGIKTKSNIQSIGKISNTTTPTSSTPTGTGYDIQDMTNRLNAIEQTIGNKANQTDLEALETKVDELDTSASSTYLRMLAQTVNLHTEQIQSLAGDDGTVYDNSSQQSTNVFFVNTFDESILN